MADLPIMSLEQEVNEAINELLRRNIYHKPVYSPALRRVGERLEQSLANSNSALRPEVAAFAKKMSDVMNIKANEKGEPDQKRRDESLMLLAHYNKQLQENQFILCDPTELRKVLIHIANFAMLAESNIKEK